MTTLGTTLAADRKPDGHVVGSRLRREQDGLLAALSLAAFLVAFENIVALLTGGELFASGVTAAVVTGALLLGIAPWVIFCRLGRDEIGVRKTGRLSATLLGSGVGITAGALILALLSWGPGAGGPVSYTPLASMTVPAVLVRALIWIPIATALPEELAFRGALLALLLRRQRSLPALMTAAVPFALWHGLIVFHTVAGTSLASSPSTYAVGCVAGFLAVLAGGVLFGLLRLRAGLAASFSAHWTFNASIIIGLYFLGR